MQINKRFLRVVNSKMLPYGGGGTYPGSELNIWPCREPVSAIDISFYQITKGKGGGGSWVQLFELLQDMKINEYLTQIMTVN